MVQLKEQNGDFSNVQNQPDAIITTVKNIVTSMLPTNMPTTADEATISEEQSFFDLQETVTSNNTMTDFTENVTSAVDTVVTWSQNGTNTVLTDFQNNTTIDESVSNNSTIITTTTGILETVTESFATNMNNTIIDEAANSNSTSFTNTGIFENVTTESTVSNITESLATVTMSEGNTESDIITTTTENVISTVTSTVRSLYHSPSTEESPHQDHMGDEENFVPYIVLGVLLGLVIVMSLIGLVLYRRCRKNRMGSKSGNYCVTQFKDISSSSERCNDELTKVDIKM